MPIFDSPGMRPDGLPWSPHEGRRPRERRRALDALPSRPNPTRAFVSTFVPGTHAQLDVVRDAVAGAHLDRREQRKAERFLVHLLVSSERDGDGSVPVPAKLIEREFRNLSWPFLEEAGVIQVAPYDRHRGRCREFAAAPEVRGRFFEAGPTASVVAEDCLYDLVSTRPTSRRVKSDRRTPSGNPLPPLLRSAIDAFGEVPVDVHAIERHLGRLHALMDAAEEGPAKVAAEGRYYNDLRCYHAVLAQGARPLDPDNPDGLWVYRPAYRPQRFGRLSQKGGGLQSCSTAMKAVAYHAWFADPAAHPDPHASPALQPVRNKDLRASQPRLLVVLLREAGLDPSWLVAYGERPAAKHEAAAFVGIPVDAWKTALNAMLMGGRVPSVEQATRSESEIVVAVREAVSPDAFGATYRRFLDYTAPLRAVLARWHRWLVTVYVPGNARLNNADGKRYLTNEAGAKVAVEDLMEEGKPWKLKARLAAFLLQGREAALMHALAASAAEYGFRVLSHEHDGLVVAGEVPEAAVEAAARIARVPMDLVDLVDKPFV